MSLIKSREEAARLARLLVLDLPVNHADEVRAGTDVSASVAEARARFQERVDPSLHDVYETNVAEMLAAMRGKKTRKKRARKTAKPTRRAEWAEQDGDAELGTVIAFEGADLDEQAALEIENFGRALQTPEREDAGGAAMVSSEYGDFIRPRNALGLGLGALLAFVAYAALDGPLVGSGGWNSPAGAGAIAFLTFLFVLGGFAPTIVVWIKTRQALPRARSTKHAYRLGISSTQLVVERPGFRLALELGDIERFEGGDRLTVLRRSSGSLVLPCGLPSGAHAALAARLNEILLEHRGYRG